MNILDVETRHAGGNAYAAAKGMAVVIMEPLRGGTWAFVPMRCRPSTMHAVKRTPPSGPSASMYNFPRLPSSPRLTMEQLERTWSPLTGIAGDCTRRRGALCQVRQAMTPPCGALHHLCAFASLPPGRGNPKNFPALNDAAVFDHGRHRRRYGKMVTRCSHCVEWAPARHRLSICPS